MTNQIVLRCLTFSFSFWGRGDRWLIWSNYRWFFATLFGGTPAQVSGPTGPMTVVVTTVIASW